MQAIILIIAALLCVMRFTLPPSQAYQAVAHLFVGGLCGAWCVNRDKFLLSVAGAMSVVEVIAFVIARM